MTASEADAHKYFTGNIGIADGRIAFAGADPQQAAAFRARCGTSLREIDGRGKVAMPGLVNLHNHVSMSLMRSYADDMPLMPWLTEKIWPFEAKLDGEDIYLGARLGIAEMLLGGTTTFVDMYWHSDRVADAVTETGIRGVVCPTFVGASYDAFEPEALRMAEKYVSGGHDRVQIMLAPHAPYTCPPETLKKTLKIAEQYGLGIHIHISETLDEQQTIREQYGKTPVEHLRDVGLFERPVLAAHCVYVNDSDIEIMARYGRIDVLINGAGGNMAGATIAPDKTIFDLDIEAVRKVVDLNLFGIILPTMTFTRAMIEQKQGSIINISSESAIRPLTRVAGYGVAKAAVTNFTKYMCGELATKYGDGLRVNAIAPGFFITEQNRTLLLNPDGSYTERSKTILAHTPYGRFGEPSELLGTLQWLASDASKFVSGTMTVIDGGFDAFSI